ncbi:MAG: ATP-binding protein [Bacteroidota bacterium]
MSKKSKTYFNWSSGKDASLALYHLQKEGKLHIDRLLTSINQHFDRVSMHGLRRELLEKQAQSIGLSLTTLELPLEPSMEDYDAKMTSLVEELKNQGYTDTAFGDIFLADLREYREAQLAPFGIQCHFPLWERDTKELIQEFLELGFRAVVVCVKSELLDQSFVGREIDQSFVEDLPPTVDPCGENGEFHTFCYAGPIFKQPIAFEIGEKVFRAYKSPKQDPSAEELAQMGFWFCDLIPL